jgi:dipeptidyl aminopeptidase/acylaminoacyl peptidase
MNERTRRTPISGGRFTTRQRTVSTVLVSSLCVAVGGCAIKADQVVRRDANAAVRATNPRMIGATAITVVPPTPVVSTSTVDPNEQCTAPTGAVGTEGMVTWIRGDRVYGVMPDSSVGTCLYQLPSSNVETMRWSPKGNRVLLGSSWIGSPDGLTPSGFNETADVKWSLPTGDGLIAIDNGKLIKKIPGGEPFDLSFLPTHLAVGYHPSGDRVVSSGVDLDVETGNNALGIWIADDTGNNKRLIVSHGDALAVGEPIFNPSGDRIYFTAEHAGLFQVHRYNTADSSLETLLEGSASIDHLVVDQTSSEVDSLAVQVGSCEGTGATDVSMIDPQAASDSPRATSLHAAVPELREKWLTPIGWLPNHALAVMARNAGCEGPGAIWLLRTPTDSSGKKFVNSERIVDDIVGAAVRVPQSEVFNPGLFIGGPPVS